MSNTPESHVQHTHIGGQAVMEGVMMRGKYNWGIAIRRPDGGIHTEAHELTSSLKKKQWMTWPIVRGVIMLFETLALGLKAFSISAQWAGDSEEEQLSSREVSFSLIFGVLLAVGLFIVLPAVVTNWVVGAQIERPFAWNVVDGLLRVVAFFGYIWAISRMGEIQRVFAYHGAEHKTIHAYEHKIPLDAGLIQKYSTAHMRCGTSFLLMVMIVALIVYSLTPVRVMAAALGLEGRIQVLLLSITLRLLLLPLIAGLAYEVIKFAGNHSDNPMIKVLLWPGLMLQKMTTREPDDDMIEVAVAAMVPVLEREGLMEGVELSSTMRASIERDEAEAEPDADVALGVPEAPEAAGA